MQNLAQCVIVVLAWCSGSATAPAVRPFGVKLTSPGCNTRPDCNNSDDRPCGFGTFFPDLCWPQVFYECANGWPIPKVCPDPLVFHYETPSGVCDFPTTAGPHNPNYSACGCADSCAIPPICPKVHHFRTQSCAKFENNEWEGSGENSQDSAQPGQSLNLPPEDAAPCNGTILLPHNCDCQLYWTCDIFRIAHLTVCGQHEVFVPRDPYSGTCFKVWSVISENAACLNPDALKIKLEGPKPLPTRHPLAEFLLAHKTPIPKHLQQYTNLPY